MSEKEKNTNQNTDINPDATPDTDTNANSEEEYVESIGAADLLADVIADEKTAEEEKLAEEKAEAESEDEDETEDGEDGADGKKGKKRKKGKKAKKRKEHRKKGEHKKLKHGMMTTIYTIVFIAVIVLVNVIATIIFDKYPITFDLTQNDTYSISEESEEYVKTIDTEVSIKVFATEDAFVAINDYSKQANEVMKKYAKYNSKISVEYIDIDSNPDVVSDYADENISTYDIIVETVSKDEDGNEITDDNGDPIKRIRTVSLLDLVEFTDDFEEQVSNYGMSAEDYLVSYFGDETTAFVYSVSYGVVASSTADQAFISALMAVSDPDPVVVTILTGREEVTSLTYFQKLLLANGYTVNTIDITSEDIPEDTDMCIIPAPQQDYLEADIEKVDTFINNDGNLGKNLIYIASYQQTDTPNLDEFLEEYCIDVGDGIVCESDTDHYYTQPYLTLADDISDNFVQDVTSESPKIMFYGSRPITLLADEKGKIGTEAYVSSTESAYVADMQTGEETSNGQQIYAAVASKAKFNDDGSADYSNILVIGSDAALSDTYLMYDQYQNREYFLSVVNGLTGKSSTGITIEPKVITGNIFDITSSQITLLKVIFIGVIPAITLIIGLVIWLRRKNR